MTKKFYIFTPAGKCSGGPEALHQLAFYMRMLGLEVYNVYYNSFGFVDSLPPNRYQQYKPSVARFAEIEDISTTTCIAPENAPWCLNNIHKAKRCILWLGVGANEILYPNWRQVLAYSKRRLCKQTLENARFLLYNDNKCFHLCGSKYAYEYVSEKYPNGIVKYLVEPISKDFYEIGNSVINKERKDIVLYNPSKPSEKMNELLERAGFEYVPLRGYTPDELARIYQDAKLYIDLGRFDGPERMPKETVFFGCNILVANHNAAANDFDVAIPQEYKINDNESAEYIEAIIAEMLKNYELHYPKFDCFRKKIEQLEQTYMQQIKEIFIDGELS